AKIIADEQGINLVGASCEFYEPEIIAEYLHNRQNPKRDLNDDDEHIERDRFLKKGRNADGSTPPNKIRTINERTSQRKRYDSDSPPCDEDHFSSDSDSEIVPVSLTNETEVRSRKTKRPYITRDIAAEVLKKYQMCVLAGKKLTYNDVDVLDFVRSNMNKDMKKALYLQDQDSGIKAVCFATEQSIDKFVVDREEENDILLQSMSESELNAYVWTLLLRNAFLGKDYMKLSCGELSSKSYEKLKEILNIAGRSAPKLDGKGFLKYLGTEILAQEDGVLNTHSKRTGDLRKLEYCSKVILTT
ncbi:13343_t:CDS:2, partial [Acaulospora colombiana]